MRLIMNGLSRRNAAERIASQIPDREKVALADFVIKNNESKTQLKHSIDALYRDLKTARKCSGNIVH